MVGIRLITFCLSQFLIASDATKPTANKSIAASGADTAQHQQ